MGIGQISIVYYRYTHVDYLPRMFGYEVPFMSAAPKEVISYATIFLPFDKWVWTFSVVSMVASAVAILQINKLYGGNTYIFESE